MTHEHEKRELTDLEREALQHLPGLTVAAPSAKARERARAAFLYGEAPRQVVPMAPRKMRPLVPLALAAGIALALVLVGNQSPDRWRVLASTTVESVLVDDTAPEVARAFDAATGKTMEGRLDVQLGQRVRVLVEPESEVVFPRGPGRWFGHSRVLRVDEGEICATTEGQGLGFELVVETPEARTWVRGTTFAVTRNEIGTRVCLYEGSVEVAVTGDESRHEVPVMQKLQVYRDGRPPEVLPLTDGERTMLATMRTQGIADQSR